MKIQKLSILALALLATQANANPEKLATYQTMRGIAAQIESLKQQTGVDTAAQIASLQSQFKDLQNGMGGDDPTRSYEANRRTVARVPTGSGPTPPSGMTVTTTSATNSTPVPINDVATNTSTLTIAGAGTYLWDVDLTALLTHTFAADMDITLTSPAGTVVTISTDNGAGNDNVFNGSFFDDDANPAGAVPYTTNDGVTTDQVYVNLTTATPLVAEGSLGAFRGEDPNGTWTLTVTDDLAGDTGSIDGFTIDAHTLTSSPTLTPATGFVNTTPVAIADVATTTHTINVSGLTGVIVDTTLTTNITHTFAADMDITLTSPTGTVVTLTTDNGAGNDNVFNGTLWDDNAATTTTDNVYANLVTAANLVPEESMSAFTGEDPNGTWTLTVSDDLAGDTGSIDSSALAFVLGTAPCVAIVCPANVSSSTAAGTCASPVTFAAPTGDPGCGTITCDATSGNSFGLGVTNVTCTAQAGPTCGFTVTVNDTEAPVMTCPTDIATQPTSQQGATVNFTAPVVTDNCPGVGAATCAPASGSIFSTGVTSVTCSATDAATNAGNCGFQVLVGAQTSVPVLNSLGLFALILGFLGFAWVRRQTI
ncbi:proprotein convertase P-domain-containing protein [Ahniella affigens]|nr:proprotein convertase P-domain-containing protein [Ahniella affigens]